MTGSAGQPRRVSSQRRCGTTSMYTNVIINLGWLGCRRVVSVGCCFCRRCLAPRMSCVHHRICSGTPTALTRRSVWIDNYLREQSFKRPTPSWQPVDGYQVRHDWYRRVANLTRIITLPSLANHHHHHHHHRHAQHQKQQPPQHQSVTAKIMTGRTAILPPQKSWMNEWSKFV